MFRYKTHTVALLILVVVSTSAFGQDQVATNPKLPMKALVIGNQTYGENINSLNNPVNDAKLMESTLTKIGFDVATKFDLTHEQMDDAIVKFIRDLEPGSVSFFYYAGHGMQDSSGRNYLIPVDAKLPTETSVKYQTVDLNYIVDSLEKSPSGLRILVLDCCRDNPFSRGWGRSARKAGLSEMVAPDGTFIAYSTKGGMTASDGEGVNSLYTEKLAQSLEASIKRRTDLVKVFQQASQAVHEKTGQRPFLNFDASMPDFFFAEGFDRKGMANIKMPEALLEKPEEENKNSNSESTSPSRTPEISAKFAKVEEFKQKKELKEAINQYTQIIADSLATQEDQRQARLGRGALLLSLKSNKDDIIGALKDYLAAREKSLDVVVEADKADLVVNKSTDGSSLTNEIKGQIFQGDRVKLTTFNGNWVWVSEVNGDKSKSGWVEASKFAKPPPVPPKLENPDTTLISPQIVGQNGSVQQPYNRRPATRPPRPRNAWETPEWEPAGKAAEMRRAQEEWDRLYGGR